MTAILVILTIILFITIDYFVYRKRGTALIQVARKTVETESPKNFIPKPITEDDVLIPSGIFIHPKHTWAHILKSGRVMIGLDDFVSKLFSKVDKISLPGVGVNLKVGDPVFSVSAVGKKLNFVSPISGEVVAINEELMNNLSLFKEPYKLGWFAIVEPVNLSEEVSKLKIAGDAAEFLKNEFKRFKEFILGANTKLGLQTLPDGGLPTENILELVDENQLQNFFK